MLRGRGPRRPKIIPSAVLLDAYARGCFPMARTAADQGIDWILPEYRGVIPLEAFHVSRRLARTVRKDPFRVTIDTAFPEVMRLCAAPDPDRDRANTWISGVIRASYEQLFQEGNAHSVECWDGAVLAGGLYGVRLGAAFFGESMFSRARDASKIALVHLVARLKRGRFALLDTQFLTRHLSQFGAIEIDQDAYATRLKEALTREANFYELGPAGAATSGFEVLQETTQTS